MSSVCMGQQSNREAKERHQYRLAKSLFFYSSFLYILHCLQYFIIVIVFPLLFCWWRLLVPRMTAHFKHHFLASYNFVMHSSVCVLVKPTDVRNSTCRMKNCIANIEAAWFWRLTSQRHTRVSNIFRNIDTNYAWRKSLGIIYLHSHFQYIHLRFSVENYTYLIWQCFAGIVFPTKISNRNEPKLHKLSKSHFELCNHTRTTLLNNRILKHQVHVWHSMPTTMQNTIFNCSAKPIFCIFCAI